MTKDVEIKTLDLHPKFKGALLNAKLLSARNVLALSVPELQRETRLSEEEVCSLLSVVAHAILELPVFTTAFQLRTRHEQQRLSVGCPLLNQFLHGGILKSHITEISGESASGKTQFCLQLAIHAQLPTTENGISVAYVCTEDVFPIKRLYQMIMHLKNQRDSFKDVNIMDNIHIAQIGDLPNLWSCVRRMLPALLEFKNVKLVIIDSVAALFRCEYDINNSIERSRDLQKLGTILHRLATRYKVAVVCVNQVTGVFDRKLSSLARNVIPSLGLTWSNLIHTRLMLSRTDEFLQRKQTSHSSLLTLRLHSIDVVFAPHLPPSSCHFVIREEGVQGLSSSDFNWCVREKKELPFVSKVLSK